MLHHLNSQAHKAISHTFQSTAHLANLLPTGTVLLCAVSHALYSALATASKILQAMCSMDWPPSLVFRGVDSPESLPAKTARKYRIRFLESIAANIKSIAR
ncbi:hypothetical protein IEQ34_021156 [Dendrobium chrysotoxum]|uniref:Uncharacterized protein n=1 Tax=Dendrobium chrysotoxum TaxID=161865 RepID=A0AAV7FLP6_DENCH|nr:hypothetical protein IEQ34_021156 [Dendrobium chrysotoxum]